MYGRRDKVHGNEGWRDDDFYGVDDINGGDGTISGTAVNAERRQW